MSGLLAPGDHACLNGLRGLKIMAENGRATSNGTAIPAVNGRAYPLTDHTYDVVIVGAGGAGLRATLGFGQIDEIMAGGLDAYLDGILRQCGQVHGAMYRTYVSYPIEAALEA